MGGTVTGALGAATVVGAAVAGRLVAEVVGGGTAAPRTVVVGACVVVDAAAVVVGAWARRREERTVVVLAIEAAVGDGACFVVGTAAAPFAWPHADSSAIAPAAATTSRTLIAVTDGQRRCIAAAQGTTDAHRAEQRGRSPARRRWGMPRRATADSQCRRPLTEDHCRT